MLRATLIVDDDGAYLKSVVIRPEDPSNEVARNCREMIQLMDAFCKARGFDLLDGFTVSLRAEWRAKLVARDTPAYLLPQ